MFNPITTTSNRVTLDWDFSQFSQLRKQLKFIFKHIFSNYPFQTLKVWTSATKGFHVEIIFIKPVNLANMRNILKDDGFRLVMDIMRNRPEHDVLWKFKTVKGKQTPEKILVFEFDGYTRYSNVFDYVSEIV